jgi:hypothetical protein
MKLWLCTATGAFGIYSDYVWAKDRRDAVIKFEQEKGQKPYHIQLVK